MRGSDAALHFDMCREQQSPGIDVNEGRIDEVTMKNITLDAGILIKRSLDHNK